MVAPAVPLYEFQTLWLADRNRFKIGNMSRQIGKSFVVALEVVDDAMETGKDWVLLSAGERQSKELMEKVQMHCKAYMIAASEIEVSDFNDKDNRYTMLTITLFNGARIIGLPANPATARGFSANVVLDEFAFHKDSDKIWRALFPTISRGYKIRIISTPQGLGNRFHRLMTGENGWSKHTVDIYRAVKDGVPHDIEMLRQGIDDPDAWQQEFEVLFIDDASAWLDYLMILNCVHDNVPQELHYDALDDSTIDAIVRSIKGTAYAGLDISRRRDLTVLDIEDLVGDVFWERTMIIFPKVRLTQQKEMLWKIIDRIPRLSRICIDATGLGLSLAEDTVDRYGTSRAEAVEFTNAVKHDLAVRTRGIFEDRRCRISNCQKARDDYHAVKKTTTAAGNTRYDAERTDLGHADRFWAKSLAFSASAEGVIKPELITLSA